ALATWIRQRRLTPSCGGHAPTAERTVGPARMIVESLTPRPGIREQNRPQPDSESAVDNAANRLPGGPWRNTLSGKSRVEPCPLCAGFAIGADRCMLGRALPYWEDRHEHHADHDGRRPGGGVCGFRRVGATA